jgi:uncharacterized protein YjdB
VKFTGPRSPWRAARPRVVMAAALASAVGAGAAALGIACSRNNSTVSGPAATLRSIALSPVNDTLIVGANQTFTARPLDANNNLVSGVSLSWASSNTGIVTVTQTGVATGVAPGTAQIAASAYGINGLATVTVVQVPVASVIVAPSSATTRIGATVQLTDTTKSASGSVLSGRAVTWASDNTTVASVDQTGLVTARSVGTAHVSATIPASPGQPQVTGQSTITVSLIPLGGLSVMPNHQTLFVGQTTELAVIAVDSAGNQLTGRVVTWQSLTPNVATVIPAGTIATVTGVAPGTGVIQVTAEGQIAKDSLNVFQAPPNSIAISPGVLAISVGAPVQTITAQVTNSLGQIVPGAPVAFRVTNPSVSVTQIGVASGAVTGLTAGTDTIVATSSHVSGIAIALVQSATVASVAITPSPLTVTQGNGWQATVAAVVKDKFGNTLARPVTWATLDPTVAALGSAGGHELVTGVNPGGTSITATADAGQPDATSDKATVAVVPAPVSAVTITPSPGAVNVTGKITLTAALTDAKGNALTGRALAWTTSNAAVASIDGETGTTQIVTGVGAGSATITATSTDGPVGSATVNVGDPVTRIDVAPNPIIVTQSYTVQAFDTAFDVTGARLPGVPIGLVTQSGGSVASVNASGVVTGNAVGKDVLVATAQGKQTQVAITVNLDPVNTVTVAPNPAAVNVDGTVTLTATLKDAKGSPLAGRPLAWKSSNATVASVDGATGETEVVTGRGGGSATITATSPDGASGSATVNVSDPVASVAIAPHSPPAIQWNSTTTLSATVADAHGKVPPGATVTWTSSPSGRVSPATTPSGGTVTVTPQESDTTSGVVVTASSGGKQDQVTLKVTPVLASSVSISPSSASASVGGSKSTLIATAFDASHNPLPGRAVSWTIDDPSIGQLGTPSEPSPSSVVVTPGGPNTGATTVHASADGQPASAAYTVFPQDTINQQNVSFSAALCVSTPGTCPTLTAVLRSANGAFDNGATVTWSGNDGGTTLSYNPASSASGGSGQYSTTLGIVTAPTLTTTVIVTATSSDGQTAATTTVTVLP